MRCEEEGPPVLLYGACVHRDDYSLSLKINAIVGLNTETNARCKMIKIPLVLYEKDLAIDLSFT
jgi:hypothetical protein